MKDESMRSQQGPWALRVSASCFWNPTEVPARGWGVLWREKRRQNNLVSRPQGVRQKIHRSRKPALDQNLKLVH